MKNSLIYIMFICFFISCSGIKKSKKPKNLISKEHMVNVLLDMAILTSAKGINKSKIEKTGIVPESFIYQKHNIDSLQFVESNLYYTYHINEYQYIINKVEDSLNKLKEDYNILFEKEEEEKRIQDSVKRSKRVNKETLNEGVNTNNLKK